MPDFVTNNPNIAVFDAQKLQFPLVLRRWQQNDRFQPLGMGGKSQLVSDLFRSKKLSVFEKETHWILETADKQICWIVGLRQDERFKVTDQTQAFWRMTYHR